MMTQRSKAGHIPAFRRVVFRKEYWIYYVMSFLEGSKKHVSSTFSIFLLVSVFEISAKNMSLIFLAISIITSFSHQQLGRITDRFQERNILSFYYVFMIAVYLFLGFASNVWVVIVVFVLARIAMGLAVALDSYFQKIAPSEEITSNVSMRTTIDHAAAILVPLIGGILWKSVGYYATFLMGVAMVTASLALSRFIKPRGQRTLPPEPSPGS
jgi:predicted MFS family arabinose efflux permease